jgi:hypothetical protein
VSANATAEHAAYARFMAATAKTKPKTAPRSARGHRQLAKIPTAGLTAAVSDGRGQAAQLTRAGMPVYYPRLIKTGSYYCADQLPACVNAQEPASEYAHSYPREYRILDRQGVARAAYRMTIAINPSQGLYYGVQGTTWRNPPLLDSPSGTRTINRRKLYLYANGGRLTTVAWHNGPDTYWISNTLTSSIPNGQMIGIAASLVQ